MLGEGEILPKGAGGAKPPDPQLQLAELIAFWLDKRYLDPLLGLLIPGLGDLLTATIGVYTVALARQRRMPPVIIARMLLNLSIDALLGAVPIAGDLFDLFFRAHLRNVELLKERPAGSRGRASDWIIVGLAALLFTAALAVPVISLILLVRWLAG